MHPSFYPCLAQLRPHTLNFFLRSLELCLEFSIYIHLKDSVVQCFSQRSYLRGPLSDSYLFVENGQIGGGHLALRYHGTALRSCCPTHRRAPQWLSAMCPFVMRKRAPTFLRRLHPLPLTRPLDHRLQCHVCVVFDGAWCQPPFGSTQPNARYYLAWLLCSPNRVYALGALCALFDRSTKVDGAREALRYTICTLHILLVIDPRFVRPLCF